MPLSIPSLVLAKQSRTPARPGSRFKEIFLDSDMVLKVVDGRTGTVEVLGGGGGSAARILNTDTGLYHTLTVSGEVGKEVIDISAGAPL